MVTRKIEKCLLLHARGETNGILQRKLLALIVEPTMERHRIRDGKTVLHGVVDVETSGTAVRGRSAAPSSSVSAGNCTVPPGTSACAMPNASPTMRQERRSSATARTFHSVRKPAFQANVRGRVKVHDIFRLELLIARSPSRDQRSFAPRLAQPGSPRPRPTPANAGWFR